LEEWHAQAVLVTLRIRHRVRHFDLTRSVRKHAKQRGNHAKVRRTKATLLNAGPDRNAVAGGIGNGLMFAKIANGKLDDTYSLSRYMMPGDVDSKADQTAGFR
jgi:hypothetical protein